LQKDNGSHILGGEYKVKARKTIDTVKQDLKEIGVFEVAQEHCAVVCGR